MPDPAATYSSAPAIRVHLDPNVLNELIYGSMGDEAGRDEKSRLEHQRMCSLREHQVYLLMRSMVSQFNHRLKGRRERFKLVEEGDGLIVEFSS